MEKPVLCYEEQVTMTPSDSTGASLELEKMKVAYFSNEFPYDDLRDLARRLRVHSKDLRHTILERFIAEATRAVREEIRLLPTSLRLLIQPFDNLFDLANQATLRSGELGGAVDGVLLCAVQIAALIGYYEDHPEEEYGLSYNDVLTGLGTGLISAAAISLSPTLAELPLAGAQVIRVAFRLGVLVDEVSQNLQSRQVSSSSPRDSWAYVVPNVVASEVQEELDSIHTAEKTPTASKVFISALNQTSVTVSGPPARLKHVFYKSDFLRDCKYVALPVFAGLCHAKHVYTQGHIEHVIQTPSLHVLSSKSLPRVPVLSTSTGMPFEAKNAKELFHAIIEEILTQAIQWDNVIQGVVQKIKDMAVSECHLLVCRTSLPVHDLLAAFDTADLKTTTKDFVSWINMQNPQPEVPHSTAQSKIAIVGMSCRLPGGATDTEKFWKILEEGLDVHRKIPADRFDVETHFDPDGKRINASHTPYGCFIDDPGHFDAPFFNMSPREASQTDPMQRLALVTAYEALERSGYVANRTAATDLHRIGTFYGQASDDYREVNSAQEISTYFITGGCRAFGPGRINYFFKFSGPSYSIDTACSSGLATIQMACTSLWNGDIDMAVAGGMNVLSNSDAFAGLSQGHFLTKTPNACKTWDAEADGYCRADGICSIVIKRLEDAEADNDNIIGVILGAGTNHSADAVSITHPHAGAQAYLTSQIMSQAGVDPLDVSYVEMHGTGTQAGDAQEIVSVCDVFAPLTRRRSPKQPLYIGSVKANVGHGEAVAGPTALLKVLLMLEKEIIPPHVGIKTKINPGFPRDLDKRNLHIPYGKQSWHRVPGKKRVAVINNFSAAGGNSTLAIEEGSLRNAVEGVDPRAYHIITISAKSKISLKGNLQRLAAYLNTNPDVSLPNLAYTTTARRHHHQHRVAIASPDTAHLKKYLSSANEKVDNLRPIPSTGSPPIIFAFTGQGAAHQSMNLELFRDSAFFKAHLLHLDSISQGQGFPSFIPSLDGSHPQDYTHAPVISQLALCCIEIALAKYWESLGVKADAVVGHSLGEYAALHVAGVLSASDTIFLVGQRALLLEKKCQIGSHKMLAVRASVDEIQESTRGEEFELACINGPKDTVLSGTHDQINAVSEVLKEAGFKCFSLHVDYAFHSEQMDCILEYFEQIASTGVLFQPPGLPVISALLGKVVFDEKTINGSYLRRATRETVNFLSAIQVAHRVSTVDESMSWIEIGPHPVCLGFTKSILPSINVAVPSFRRGEDNWQTLSQSLGQLYLAGMDINWQEFHRSFEQSLRLLDLPTYAWNNKNYWIQYNGNWALTKGNTFYDSAKATQASPVPMSISSLKTSSVQSIIEETFSDSAGRVVMQSDLMQPDFLAAAWGHKMNNCGVVTSSIHADIAFTLGRYVQNKLRPHSNNTNMNMANLEVLKGLIAKKDTSTPQLIQVSIFIENIDSGVADLTWHNVINGKIEERFASANIIFSDAETTLSSWVPMTHLVQGRIETLERLAEEGVANRFSRNMAYLLFANNLVDYAEKYRGMHSVVLHGFEAFADITLTYDKGGVWTIPPQFIDSVAHLAGFIMNVSDAGDVKNNFCVTPGWRSLQFAKPLVAGGKYRSYVKMIPSVADPNVYHGDVFILQDNIIIGMCGAIKFRRYKRLLLDRFFSAPDESALRQSDTATAPIKVTAVSSTARSLPAISIPLAAEPVVTTVVVDIGSDSTTAKAMTLVAAEAAIDVSELQDDVNFANIGVDSLMSLVIAEKFREELAVTVNGSLFLEYPTVGDLRAWLLEYYG